jgi:serine protease Do
MFDMKGNVIGVNNAIISPTGGSVGIGFAIPAEVAGPIVEKLMKGQSIERGYLGIRIQPLDEDLGASLGLADKRGEFVQAVEPGGAADKAGLKAGDVILQVDGKEVTPDQTLSFIVANIAPGKAIPIALIREGKRLTVTTTVGRRPSEEELAKAQMFDPDAQEGQDGMDKSQGQGNGVIEQSLGLQVIPLTPGIASQLGAPDNTRGLVVAAVDPSSDAGAKGLQRGDILLSANYRAVTKAPELEVIVKEAQKAERAAVLLQIQRRGRPATYIPVRLRD